MISQYNVVHSLFISLKYHYSSTQSQSTVMHMSDLGMSSKILSQQKSGSCAHNDSWRAISSSSFLYQWQLPKCCFTSSNKLSVTC